MKPSAVDPEPVDLAREPAFALGEAQVRPSTRELVLAGVSEILEPRVMQVLVALARRQGEVVSRDELIACCWSGRIVGDDAINRCIGRIRRLSETCGGFTLETIPRVGYRLTTVTSQPDSCQAGAREETGVLEPPTRSRGRPALIYGLVALLLALCGTAYWISRPEQKPTVGVPAGAHTIAVLPFTPLYSDKDAQLYADSITSTIADALSKLGMPVVPPAESFRFRGAGKAEAAQALKARYIIDGEVRRASARIDISFRLVDAVTGTTILAHEFTEPDQREPALADEVAAYVAALGWGTDFTALEPRVLRRILRVTEEQERGDVFAAYQTARAAADALPDSAIAQLTAAAQAINLFYGIPAARNLKIVAEARQAAETALKFDPSEGDAFTVLTSTTPPYKWAVREAYLRKALAVSPDSAGAAQYMAWLLNEAGRFRDAGPFARSAYERFPYQIYSFSRQIDQLLGFGPADAETTRARTIIPQARWLWPDNTLLIGQAYEATALKGAFSDADKLLREPDVVGHLSPATLRLWIDALGALRGRRATDINAVSRDCSEPGESWWTCMVVLSMIGKIDQAFSIADSAYPDLRGATEAAIEQKWLTTDVRSTRYLFVPEAAPLRADPRFLAIVDRIGLLPYWKKTHHPPDFCAKEKVPVCQALAGG